MATNFVSYAKHKPHAIFAIFTSYESVLGVDDRSEIFFQYLKGCCHGNQFSVVLDLFAQSISASIGPIFTIFAPYGRY